MDEPRMEVGERRKVLRRNMCAVGCHRANHVATMGDGKLAKRTHTYPESAGEKEVRKTEIPMG